MRRITLTAVTTLAILVLLFSYRTSRNQSVTASTVAAASAHVVSGGSASAVSSAAGPDPTGNPITILSTSSASSSATAMGTPAARPTTTPAVPSTTVRSGVPSNGAAPATSTSALTTTVDGAAIGTRYGDVQVEVTITSGKITDVQALAYPNQEPRDQEINAQALPLLQAQVLAAQSANVAGVSGATYTTEGYIASLQSALDAANFH